jgi:hypothetical protein
MWENEVERFVKQRNLTSDDATNWQIEQLKTSNWRTSGKLTD